MLIEDWRRHHNTVRLQSSLNYRPPPPESILPIRGFGMRRILGLLLFALVFTSSTLALGEQTSAFDSLVNVSLSLSEKALYAANFEEAARFVSIAHFEKFSAFQNKHLLQLSVQSMRIESFKNRLRQKSTDGDQRLAALLSLEGAADSVSDDNALGDYFVLLASAYRSVDESDSADYFEAKALQHFTSAGNTKKVAQIQGAQVSRRHMAFLAASEREKILALIPEYEKEIEFARSCENKYVLAYNTRHLAQVYRRQTSENEKAMRLFQESLDLREEIGFRLFLPGSYASIGDVALKKDDHEKAKQAFLKAIELAEQVGFVRFEFSPRIKLGEMAQSKGDAEEAKEYYLEALKSASKNGYEIGVDEALKKLEGLR